MWSIKNTKQYNPYIIQLIYLDTLYTCMFNEPMFDLYCMYTLMDLLIMII